MLSSNIVTAESQWTEQERSLLKLSLEDSMLLFARYFFRINDGSQFIVNAHHKLICNTLERVLHGEIKRLVINLPPGYTKCFYDAKILTPLGLKPIKDILPGDTVLSHIEGELVQQKVEATQTFNKPCVDVRLRSGRKLGQSHDHPLLTQKGWVAASDLTCEHYLVRVCSKIDGTQPLDYPELDFITLMLFEGGCSGKTTKFTSADQQIVDTMTVACHHLGIGLKQYDCNNDIDYNIMGGKVGVAQKLLRKHGMQGKLAVDKELPPAFFNIPMVQKYKFISLMIATDGFIIERTGQIGVCLGSEKLAKDISLFLDTCGIPNSYYERPNGYAGEYRVIIASVHARELQGKVNFLQKQKLFEKTCKYPISSSLIFGYPYEVTTGLTGKAKRRNINIKKKGNMITNYQFNRLATEIDDTLTSMWVKKDFIYDRVKVVEKVGNKDVYHLQIAAKEYDAQNFIADNVVAHNTELAVIYFIAKGLALNPRSRFIHASYSENLTMLNSTKIKDIIQSPEYNELWPMELRADSQSKKAWVNTVGGGLYAPSAGGQITGFRAGRSDGEQDKSFSGAFILDDPLKIEDAFSEPMLSLINGRFTGTYASRLQHQDVPIILIMQRIKDNDPTGFLLKGGSGDKWHHLNLPVIIPKEPEPYPKEWTHGIEIPHNLNPGLLWKYKHNWKDIEILKHDEYTFNAQYMQRPSPVGGGLFKEKYWGYYTIIPKMKVVVLFADTATKKGQANDYSVFLAAGLTYDGKIAVLDVHRAKYETPELLIAARSFWNKHKRNHRANRVGATTFKIEDKSSGTFLIQQFRREGIPVQDIQRNIDKVQRALSALPEFSKGNILLPEKATELTDAGWVLDFKSEHSKFTANDTHDHDDQIDTMLDAVETLLIKNLFSIYDNLR